MTNLQSFLDTHPDAVLVEVAAVRGSTPREAGAFMLVSVEALHGTIGGGQLEFMAIAHARDMLAGRDVPPMLDVPLGPEIGQCCGGRMTLRFERVDAALAGNLVDRAAAETANLPDVFIFGAGHVGLALAQALAPLPFRATLVETRDIPEATLPPGASFRRVALPEAEVAAITGGGAAVIVTHDHALDFLIARQALARPDLAYVGMIGSATKRATFANWLAREGVDPAWLDRLILPIGGGIVKDKRAPVIAAMVAAELLSRIEPAISA